MMKGRLRRTNLTLLGIVGLTAIVAITAIYFGARFGSPYFSSDPVRRIGVEAPGGFDAK